MSLVIATLSKALVHTDDPGRATAEWGGGMPNLQLTGETRDGRPFTTIMMDSPMLGGGARGDKDGIHTANVLGSTNTTSPNVEFHEQRYPIRYLKRGLREGSAGAGEFRGGVGGEFAFTVHGVDEIVANPFQHRRDSLPFGLFGGYPGRPGAIEYHDLRPVNPGTLEIEGRSPDRVFAQENEEVTVSPGEVLHVKCTGGGAIGDPLDRDLDRIREDLVEGIVRPEAVGDAYGVVIDPDGDDGVTLDADATASRRSTRRHERAESASVEGARSSRGCPACGGLVYIRAIDPVEAGLTVRDERVALELHVCQDCLDLAAVRVTVEGRPW